MQNSLIFITETTQNPKDLARLHEISKYELRLLLRSSDSLRDYVILNFGLSSLACRALLVGCSVV